MLNQQDERPIPAVQNYTMKGTALWQKKILSYSVLNSPMNIQPHKGDACVKSQIAKAFLIWQNVSDIAPFDGKGGAAAYALGKYQKGVGYITDEIHFDNEESWTCESPDFTEKSIYAVAVHEIGHVLGSGHSQDECSIMYGTSSDKQRDISLHPADIAAIHVCV